jgi:hypothetical protein
MIKEASYFGGAQGGAVHPAILAFVLVCIVLILVLPRKRVIVPFLAVALLVPISQMVIVAGLDFMMLRVVLTLAVFRLVYAKFSANEEILPGGLIALDKAVLCWGFIYTVAFTLHFMEMGALVNKLGMLYTGFGAYFFLRYLIQDHEDVDRAIKTLAVICVIFGVMMVFEQTTHRTVYGMFGAFRTTLEFREGHFRSQAAFAHPIIAGTVSASFVPLFLGLLWKGKGSRFFAYLGLAGAGAMAITCFSSTPLMTAAAGILGLFLWSIRRNLRWVRWGIVILLLVLHLSMKAPVWALINRIDLVGGSSGYHRYELVNQFIVRFSEWWMTGSDTSKWGYDMWDTSNMYVEVGTQGGFATFIAYVAILVCGFSAVGRAQEFWEEHSETERARRTWAVGCCLFGTAVGLFGITYFDQSVVIWYMLLAMIAAVSVTTKAYSTESAPQSLPESKWRSNLLVQPGKGMAPSFSKVSAKSPMLSRQSRPNQS